MYDSSTADNSCVHIHQGKFTEKAEELVAKNNHLISYSLFHSFISTISLYLAPSHPLSPFIYP